jgi:hypothetical protein
MRLFAVEAKHVIFSGSIFGTVYLQLASGQAIQTHAVPLFDQCILGGVFKHGSNLGGEGETQAKNDDDDETLHGVDP